MKPTKKQPNIQAQGVSVGWQSDAKKHARYLADPWMQNALVVTLERGAKKTGYKSVEVVERGDWLSLILDGQPMTFNDFKRMYEPMKSCGLTMDKPKPMQAHQS
jgi:hypothetical protein